MLLMPGEAIAQRCSVKKVFCKKGVLKNLAKLTGEHLSVSLFVNKVAGWRPATLLKKTATDVLLKILRTTLFIKHPRGLLYQQSRLHWNPM